MSSTLSFFGGEGGASISGAGNSALVFSSVGKVVMKYIELKDPPCITFTAAEPSRKKLYHTLSQFLQKKTNGEYIYVNDKEYEGGSFFLLKKKYFQKMKESFFKRNLRLFESSDILSKKEHIGPSKIRFYISKPKKFNFEINGKPLEGLFSSIGYEISKKDLSDGVFDDYVDEIHSAIHDITYHSLSKREEKGYIYSFKLGDTKDSIKKLFEKILLEIGNSYVFLNKETFEKDKYVLLLVRDLYNKWNEN